MFPDTNQNLPGPTLEINPQTGATTKRKVQFPTIGADAKALGVTRAYLWKVLVGRVTSKRLLTRYQALKANQTTH